MNRLTGADYSKAFSIQGEMLTAILSYQLEDELGLPQHYIEGVDIVNSQWDPWNDSDLEAFKFLPHWKRGFSMFPLRPITGDLPRNWLKQWGTNFPYYIAPPPSRSPTPIPPLPGPIPTPVPPPSTKPPLP